MSGADGPSVAEDKNQNQGKSSYRYNSIVADEYDDLELYRSGLWQWID